MGDSDFGMVLTSLMVVHDLYLRIAVRPDEADAELVVDPDTILPGPIAFERFQPVSRERPKVA